MSGSQEPVAPETTRFTADASATPVLRLVRNARRGSDEAGSRDVSGMTSRDVRKPGSADMVARVGEASASDELSPALEDVVRRFGNFMRRTAHRHNLAASELEDVVQETRIRLWKALGTPEKIRRAPASYIYRTTMSAVLDFMRRRRARRENSIDQFADAPPDSIMSQQKADDTLHQGDVERAIARAVDLLAESRRGVVRMYLAGYEREEIAELLGWSEPKTRNLIYRGLADVRESLESWGYGPGGRL